MLLQNTMRFILYCGLLLFCIIPVTIACNRDRTGGVTGNFDNSEQHNNTPPVSQPPSLFDVIPTVLGDSWKIFHQDDEWIVEQKELPVVVYTTHCPNPRDVRQKLLMQAQASQEIAEIDKTKRANIPYRIHIRIGPLIDEAEVNRRLQANLSIQEKLDSLKAEGVTLRYRMPIEDEVRYLEAWEDAYEIPCGIYQNRSVYIYLTHLRSEVTSSHKEYYTAALEIAKLLLPYKTIRLRRGPKDPRWWTAPDKDGDCAYNPLSEIKSVACLW